MQLVKRHIITRNHSHHQKLGSLYLFAKNLYNNINSHILQCFAYLLWQKAAKVSLTSYYNSLKILTTFYLYVRYKCQLTNNFIKKLNLLKYHHRKKNKYLSICPAYTKIQMKIKNIIGIFIIGIFVIRDNLLYRHHGKLTRGYKYKLVFIFLEWFINLWSYKAELSRTKFLFADCFTSGFSHCYKNQATVYKYGEIYAYRFKFGIQKISTNLYKISNSLLIHADINDSLNISRKLAPIAFS